MARFHPHEPGPGTPGSEKTTWRALEKLPNSWHVFHSVAWQVPKKSRVFDGEADFVLVNANHGMIVLEVKGGIFEIRNGTWYQRDARGGDFHKLPRSPFEQAKGAMYDLQRYLTAMVPGLSDLPSTRGVVMPAATHPGDLGPDMPAAMSIGKGELSDMPGAVERLLAHSRLNANLTTDQINGVVRLLSPTLQIRTTIGTEIKAADERLIELTEEQARILDLLRRHRRALITGGAGTGKTMLALERARRLAEEGAEVLLTCYNRPLGDFLASESEGIEGLTAMSFHAFARKLFGQAGIDIPLRVKAEWFREHVPDLIIEAAEKTGISFDAVVIDEGQDFFPRWFMAIQLLLNDPDDGPLYVFADQNQSIYVDDWVSPIDDDPFPLDINCRNTLPIARKVAAVIGAEATSMGVEGLAPQFIVANSDEEIAEALDVAIGRMIGEEGVLPEQITILADHRKQIEELKGKTIGGKVVGDLDDGGIVGETIHRYKGLENDVVFVILDKVETDQQRSLAYIGMSRARALLIVIGTRATKKAIGW